MGWFVGCGCRCSLHGPVINCETVNPLSVISWNDGFGDDCLDDDVTHGYFGTGGPCSDPTPAVDQNDDDQVDCYDGVRVSCIEDTGVGQVIQMPDVGPHKYKMSVKNGTLEAGTLNASGSVKMGHERLDITTDTQQHVLLGAYYTPEKYQMHVEICGIPILFQSVRTGTFNDKPNFYTSKIQFVNAVSGPSKTFSTDLSHYKNAMPTVSWSIEQTSLPYKDGTTDVADFDISLTGGGDSYSVTDETIPITWCNHDNWMEVLIEDTHSYITPSSPDFVTSPTRGLTLLEARTIDAANSNSHRFCYPMIDDFTFTVVETP